MAISMMTCPVWGAQPVIATRSRMRGDTSAAQQQINDSTNQSLETEPTAFSPITVCESGPENHTTDSETRAVTNR